ncbi:MAG: right-handed parallel beta-helix repeat-containing protein [Actinobacteria bacterium]|nr:MAG: right-handed parallel beta-helix repeat-containing protein [Actinomycetota bacterium]
MGNWRRLLSAGALVVGALALAGAPAPGPAAAAAATIDIHVDPSTGNDAGAGTLAAPIRTIAEAWRRVPSGAPLASPVTIWLAPGEYPAGAMPNYWEDRHGTAAAGITIRNSGASRTPLLRGDLNLFNIDYLRLQGLRIAPGGDAVHCERCGNVTIADSELDGRNGAVRAAHETYKANQSHDLTVVDSYIHGTYENAIDFVAVQRATIERNILAEADDWCAYVKGGSTQITVRGNEIRDCGTGGFTAGQGTGLEYMVPPYLTYEATDVLVSGNFVHDTEGAAFGVNGGQRITIEGNAAARVGTRSHLLEVTFGSRSGDGDAARCAELLRAGAWGTAVVGGSTAANIPDAQVTIRNNTIVNPAGVQSAWQHLEISTPRRNNDPGVVGPDPARTDDGLVITGNVIRNGGADMPLGVSGDEVCAPANPTCTVAQLLRDNDFNGATPVPVPDRVPGTAAAPASVFVPIDPARVFDSRLPGGGGGALGPQELRRVSVADAVGAGPRDVVPAGAVAIAYNLTVPAGGAAGHLRVLAGDRVATTSSAINFRADQTIANASVVRVDGARTIGILNGSSSAEHAVVDVLGYYLAADSEAGRAVVGGRFTAVAPVRAFDSGPVGSGALAAGETRTVELASAVPAGATAVAYNVTAVRAAAGGHLRVFPGDVGASGASTLNWNLAGDVVANGAVVRLDDQRRIRVFNAGSAPVQVLVDVVGYFGATGTLFHPIDPVRAYDSRAAQPQPGPLPTGVDQVVRTVGVADARAADGSVAGVDAVPAGATAVAYNLTAVGPRAEGHLRVFPGSGVLPGASALNWPAASYTRANASTVGISGARTVSIYNGSAGAVDVLIDTLGYYQ